MAEAVRNAEQEFWRPPVHAQAQDLSAAVRPQVEVCEGCGTEYVLGSRFCHVCGSERSPLIGANSRWSRVLDIDYIRRASGLSIAALVAFIVGLGCVLAAVATGLLFTATTVLDWQAVQVWRIEWLLAGCAAFIAAILLKKPAS